MSVNLTPDLIDELWQAICPHLPPRRTCYPKGGRPPADDYACLRGILYVLREGCRWQKLPSQALGCPSGSTCWRRFQAWTQAGVWNKAHVQLLDLLGEQAVLDLQYIIIDSASTRAQKGGRTPALRPLIAAKKAANAMC
jgi:transposase